MFLSSHKQFLYARIICKNGNFLRRRTSAKVHLVVHRLVRQCKQWNDALECRISLKKGLIFRASTCFPRNEEIKTVIKNFFTLKETTKEGTLFACRLYVHEKTAAFNLLINLFKVFIKF